MFPWQGEQEKVLIHKQEKLNAFIFLWATFWKKKKTYPWVILNTSLFLLRRPQMYIHTVEIITYIAVTDTKRTKLSPKNSEHK